MTSFFEKLKRGMAIEESLDKEIKAIDKEPAKKKKIKSEKAEIGRIKKDSDKPKLRARKIKIEEANIEKESADKTKEGKTEEEPKAKEKEKWFQIEGQLVIDVYQTANDLVIQSAVAGVMPENLDIEIEKDIIKISGVREKPFGGEDDYFTKECFWGPFSREIILPMEVDPNRISAQMQNGILTIKMPKISREKKRKIAVKA